MSIPIESIAALVRDKESHFWEGAAIGFLAGGAAGTFVGLATYQKPQRRGFITIDLGPGVAALGGGVLGAAAGFLVGGMIGASTAGREAYELKGKTLRTKLHMIQLVVPQAN